MAKKVILDCDPGMDDSVAIILAAKSPELDLLAVTTTHGNYPVAVTNVNARKALELVGRGDIPVASGMSRPMVRESPSDPFTHGDDGQAEAHLPEPRVELDPRHAVDVIIDLVKENWGELELIVTGPMSNVAMALVKEPSIANGIRRIIAISGAFGLTEAAFRNATGDNPMSEWNVYVDPEAADVVYRSGVQLLAIGLDVATHFDVDFVDEDLERLEVSDKAEARFLARAIGFVRGRGYGAYCAVIDAMAVAATADPTLLSTIHGRVGIATGDALTRGMTVLDARAHHGWAHLPLIEIAKDADYPRFLRAVIDGVLV